MSVVKAVEKECRSACGWFVGVAHDKGRSGIRCEFGNRYEKPFEPQKALDVRTVSTEGH